MPTTPVEIHLMIEDLANRLDEDEQGKLTELISQYAGSTMTVEEVNDENGDEGEGEEQLGMVMDADEYAE